MPFETSLIGVHLDGPDLRVWGIAHSGPAWLAPSWGGRELVPNWTNDPIIHATGPGQLAVRCAGQVVGAIDRGLLLGAMIDVFDARWLSAIFASERAEVRARHAELQAETQSPTAAEDSLVGRVTQQMLRRAIRLIRQAQHGGLILVVDAGSPPDHLDGLRLKYPIGQDEPSHRYRSLLLRLLHAVAASTSKASAGWEDFAENESTELRELEQAVFEWSRVIANLAEIDGAVVVDKRFALIGFGAEVSGDLPTPSRIWRALDTEGGERRPDDVERVGTRHRAAYRFVNRHPGALAVVISHDGAVSFVAKHGLDVVFWEQSMSP